MLGVTTSTGSYGVLFRVAYRSRRALRKGVASAFNAVLVVSLGIPASMGSFVPPPVARGPDRAQPAWQVETATETTTETATETPTDTPTAETATETASSTPEPSSTLLTSDTATLTPLPSDTATETETPTTTSSPTASLTATVESGISVTLRAAPPAIQRGAVLTIHWEVEGLEVGNRGRNDDDDTAPEYRLVFSVPDGFYPFREDITRRHTGDFDAAISALELPLEDTRGYNTLARRPFGGGRVPHRGVCGPWRRDPRYSRALARR